MTDFLPLLPRYANNALPSSEHRNDEITSEKRLGKFQVDKKKVGQ